MSIYMRLTTIAFVIIYFVILTILLKKRKLALKYSLLWIFCGIFFLIIALFPKLLIFATSLFGMEVPSNGLFAMLIGSVILILMSLTVVISEMSSKNKTLVQKMALIEKRLRELESIQYTK